MTNKNFSLSMWLKYLENLDKKTIFNLFELKSIAKILDLLCLKSFIFTVGGTNGKGTTCAMLETLLLNSGYTVGLYTSPHLINYVERVRINGCVLDENDHIDAFKNIEQARNSTLLTYFEFITLSALMLFKKHSLDVIILEVGLGGRLDATNVIDANLSIITNISLEHTCILGKDRESIAREKSGIFRKNRIAVIGDIDIPNSIIKIAQKKKTILKIINIDWFWKEKKSSWNFIHSNIQLYNLPKTYIPLSNTATALAALYYSGLKINEEIIRKYIVSVKVLGRFQIISTNPYIIIDVAHNPSAALFLSKQINNINNIHIRGKIYAILGVLRDKDILGIINYLKNKINYWYITPLQTSRTVTKKQLKSICSKISNISIVNNLQEGYKKALILAKKEDAILIFGSFFIVSEFFSLTMNKIL
ncbi:bifunctional tetrahydrofolate synthase/dihydrofolate synthase [Buchnera aphidicola]|uniref:Dihydrofolate synthase/folylpolyglutamate synthase n=1 Tax=Buchnera aphidicola (Artemisaphis artemisicola) TaxID=1241836 RepID=A0A4D6XLT6_9GAMM|nr:bifunctional tetrahydrofolate synthase/dihydrofolate synthase [Buchnera aphidicola]QCI15858.1 bifunctional tetrahydrofolate synthase/dihydrofolate synthase [Buchnera aphidicola (Artemisaphis artemisicola)]